MQSFITSRIGVVLVAFLAIAAFFLITEHTAHVFGVLPFGLLVLCLLMHLFMHGSHGGHGGQEGHAGHDQGGTESGTPPKGGAR